MSIPPQLQPVLISTTSQWLIVSKPAGWLSIPGRGSAPVLSEWLTAREGKVWTVHRLDRDTTGVILFARTAEAHRLANGWFSRHEVKKHYEFLAKGQPKAPVFRSAQTIDGARSVTQVEVRERFENCFFGVARPLTGRLHQIRRHLAAEGNPLLGDPEYGGPREIQCHGQPLEIARVALHARRLELPSGEIFEAALPEDFQGWLETLRRLP